MGPQGDLAGILQGTVLPFPHQRQSPAGKLDPDLVGSASMQMDLDQGIVFCVVQKLIIQHRLLHTLGRL